MVTSEFKYKKFIFSVMMRLKMVFICLSKMPMISFCFDWFLTYVLTLTMALMYLRN